MKATVALHKVSQHFNNQWVFRDIDYTFEAGNAYAITGPNGSGKSTLVQIVAGMLTPSMGKVSYTLDDRAIEPGIIFRHLSFAAPYMELIEEASLPELLRYHMRFKPYLNGLQPAAVADMLHLADTGNKPLRFFSSGMKQRVKLGLAVLTDAPIVLLDEPTTNLDEKGQVWYHQMMAAHLSGRLLVVCSNQPDEYRFCTHMLDLTR